MIAPSVVLDDDVVIHHPDLVNLYGCTIGAGTRIGAFVEIQRGAVIGAACKISSHTFICEGVTLEDGVFVGHGVMFTNDLLSARASTPTARLQTDADWTMVTTRVCTRRLDRQQRHHRRGRHDRRGRAGRRRRGRHARRSGITRSSPACRRGSSSAHAAQAAAGARSGSTRSRNRRQQ